MLYTETYFKDDNYVRVGDLLRHILRKHIERIEVMLNKNHTKTQQSLSMLMWKK